MVGEQVAQQDWKRQHPMAHWHPWDDAIHQVGGGFYQAPRPGVPVIPNMDLDDTLRRVIGVITERLKERCL